MFKNIFLLLIIVINYFNCQLIEHWQSEPALNKMLIQKPSISFSPSIGNNPWTILVNENVSYQNIDGFGASMTDSSAWLIKNKLTDLKRKELLESLFGGGGIKISSLSNEFCYCCL